MQRAQPPAHDLDISPVHPRITLELIEHVESAVAGGATPADGVPQLALGLRQRVGQFHVG
jgi:hypothetical protein